MTGARTVLAAVALAAVLAPPAPAAVVHRDAEAGVEVRLARQGRIAVVAFSEPTCGAAVVRVRVRRARFARTATLTCGARPKGRPQPRTLVRVTGRVARGAVRGRIGGRPYVARRGAPPPTPAQRCAASGQTLAETALVRAYRVSGRLRDRTVACRLADGAATTLARSERATDGDYAAGTMAISVRAAGPRVAYAERPFDEAADKYAAGDQPEFRPTIVVRDLVTGAVARIPPEAVAVFAVALHDDGRVAWAGGASHYYFEDVVIATWRDGRVAELDRGTIDPDSLRATRDGFAWER